MDLNGGNYSLHTQAIAVTENYVCGGLLVYTKPIYIDHVHSRFRFGAEEVVIAAHDAVSHDLLHSVLNRVELFLSGGIRRRASV